VKGKTEDDNTNGERKTEPWTYIVDGLARPDKNIMRVCFTLPISKVIQNEVKMVDNDVDERVTVRSDCG
jgi:hypothetical protein